MKERVSLCDSTMQAKGQWLELEREGSDYFVALRNEKGLIGGERTPIARTVLDNLIHVGPGVILKSEPLRFYRTKDDIRVSFTENEPQEGLSGYDRLDYKDFVEATKKILGDEEEHKGSRGSKKATPAKPKRATKSQSKSK